MKHWEFLLQKEGDRSWLPLDSPDVEILEGRYRVVARSSHVSTKVQIRISHLATDENPPKRRVQKRSGQTNPNGLLVVMPFTRLQPGVWELSCTSVDLMSDLVGDAWNYQVKLQVCARDLEDEWEPTWSPSQPEAPPVDTPSPAPVAEPTPTPAPDSAALPPEVAEILGASMDRLFQIADQMSTQLIDDVLRDFDVNAAEIDRQTVTTTDFPDLSPPQPLAAPGMGEAGSSYQVPEGYLPVVRLDQEALIADRGETLTLTGRVELEPIAEPTTIADPWETPNSCLNLGGAIAQELQLSLRDPQSLQVLISDRLMFSSPNQPFTFSFSLPDQLNTHLLLGEVLLCGTLPNQSEALATLTTQAFTVTADPQQLMGELEKLSEVLEETLESEQQSDRLNLPLEMSVRVAREQETHPLELSFLELDPQPEAPVAPAPASRFRSLEGPLPPQLYQPDPETARRTTIELPDLALPTGGALFAPVHVPDEEVAPEPEAIAATVEPTAPEMTAAIASDLAEAETVTSIDPSVDLKVAPDAATAAEQQPPPQESSLEDSPEIDGLEAEAETDAERSTIELPSPIQMAFQSLRLQDRFLNRLNSLASDAELSSWLRSNLYPGQEMPPEVVPSSRSAKRIAEEIVVDDEGPDNGTNRRRNGTRPSLKQETSTAPNPLILAEEDSVPTPIIDVPTGELTAGQMITVRARLPHLQQRIYVKLWMVDRQSRSILDGTHWFLDFYPNSKGELEATTQLNVPFGSLEMRFEAIAVEMHTQRESHKVSVDRSAVPPDLPVISLDDFAP